MMSPEEIARIAVARAGALKLGFTERITDTTGVPRRFANGIYAIRAFGGEVYIREGSFAGGYSNTDNCVCLPEDQEILWLADETGNVLTVQCSTGAEARVTLRAKV